MIIVFMNNSSNLVVGTNPAFPPFEYIGGKDGKEIVGFDIELAKIISKNYGNTMKIEVLNFSELIPALINDKIDMAISVITVTEERKKLVDFSKPYFSDPQLVIVRDDDYSFDEATIDSSVWQTKILSSRGGTTGVLTAEELSGGNAVISGNTWDTLIRELLSKRVDAVVMDGMIANSVILEYNGIKILPLELNVQNYGVAVKKGNTKLLNSINKTIDNLKASGEYNRLVEEYILKYEGSVISE